jgi:type I restriction enzyme R subunit
VTRAAHPREPELFGKRESPLRIAISLYMPDTRIDIPEAVNLVFFKIVRSKTRSTLS